MSAHTPTREEMDAAGRILVDAYQLKLARDTDERNRRIASAKQLLACLDSINKVYADLPFWIRRIKRATKRGERHITNAWSFHGDVSKTYIEELGNALRRIHPGFYVTRTYYQDPFQIFDCRVVVSWVL